MIRTCLKLAVAVGAIVGVGSLVSGVSWLPLPWHSPQIAALRFELAATEASLPGLEAQIKQDKEKGSELFMHQTSEQRMRWYDLEGHNKMLLRDANRRVTELRLRIRELESGLVPEPAK